MDNQYISVDEARREFRRLCKSVEKKAYEKGLSEGIQKGKDEATQLVRLAATLNGSTHNVIKALENELDNQDEETYNFHSLEHKLAHAVIKNPTDTTTIGALGDHLSEIGYPHLGAALSYHATNGPMSTGDDKKIRSLSGNIYHGEQAESSNKYRVFARSGKTYDNTPIVRVSVIHPDYDSSKTFGNVGKAVHFIVPEDEIRETKAVVNVNAPLRAPSGGAILPNMDYKGGEILPKDKAINTSKALLGQKSDAWVKKKTTQLTRDGYNGKKLSKDQAERIAMRLGHRSVKSEDGDEIIIKSAEDMISYYEQHGDPNDHTQRLVYADALEEHGREHEATIHRALAAGSDSKEYGDLVRSRNTELLHAATRAAQSATNRTPETGSKSYSPHAYAQMAVYYAKNKDPNAAISSPTSFHRVAGIRHRDYINKENKYSDLHEQAAKLHELAADMYLENVVPGYRDAESVETKASMQDTSIITKSAEDMISHYETHGNPLDNNERLVYADALDETGRHEEAALHRVLAEPENEVHEQNMKGYSSPDKAKEKTEYARGLTIKARQATHDIDEWSSPDYETHSSAASQAAERKDHRLAEYRHNLSVEGHEQFSKHHIEQHPQEQDDAVANNHLSASVLHDRAADAHKVAAVYHRVLRPDDIEVKANIQDTNQNTLMYHATNTKLQTKPKSYATWLLGHMVDEREEDDIDGGKKVLDGINKKTIQKKSTELDDKTLELVTAGSWEPEEDRKYSCLLMPIEGELREKIIHLASLVDDEDLGEDGREDNPHVTVRYGFKTDSPDEITNVVNTHGPIGIKLNDVTCFYGKDNDKPYDVLKIDIGSYGLVELHNQLDVIPHTDTHEEYQPHATIAYVKAGLGEHYADLFGNIDRIYIGKNLVFSDRNKNKTNIPLVKRDIKAQDKSVNEMSNEELEEHYKGKNPTKLGEYHGLLTPGMNHISIGLLSHGGGLRKYTNLGHGSTHTALAEGYSRLAEMEDGLDIESHYAKLSDVKKWVKDHVNPSHYPKVRVTTFGHPDQKPREHEFDINDMEIKAKEETGIAGLTREQQDEVNKIVLHEKRKSIQREAQSKLVDKKRQAGSEVHTNQIVDLINQHGKVNRRMIASKLKLTAPLIDSAITYGTLTGKFKVSKEKGPKGGPTTTVFSKYGVLGEKEDSKEVKSVDDDEWIVKAGESDYPPAHHYSHLAYHASDNLSSGPEIANRPYTNSIRQEHEAAYDYHNYSAQHHDKMSRGEDRQQLSHVPAPEYGQGYFHTYGALHERARDAHQLAARHNLATHYNTKYPETHSMPHHILADYIQDRDEPEEHSNVLRGV